MVLDPQRITTMAQNNDAKKLMPTISSARTAHLSIRPYPPDGNGSDGCFFGRQPIEPSIAVDSLSGMITSFIIHYLNWQECKRFGVICPNWRLITQVDC